MLLSLPSIALAMTALTRFAQAVPADDTVPRSTNSTNGVFTVDNFSIKSVHIGDCPDRFSMVQYQLQVHNENSSASCNTVTDSTAITMCDDYQVPIGFNPHACNCCVDSPWSWTLNASKSVTQPPTDGFVLRIAYDAPGETPLFGCRFISVNETCTADGELDVSVLSSFTLPTQTSSECIFA